jgi:hypothetical protein
MRGLPIRIGHAMLIDQCQPGEVAMREALGGFMVATVVGLYVGSTFTRARRSRRDYKAGLKAMRGYRNVMRKENRRAYVIVGLFIVVMAIMFASAARLGQQ